MRHTIKEVNLIKKKKEYLNAVILKIIYIMMVQFMSDESGMKTRSIGLSAVGTVYSLEPRHRMSLSAVHPGKFSWDLGLKSHMKDWRSPGSNPRLMVYKANSATTTPRRLL